MKTTIRFVLGVASVVLTGWHVCISIHREQHRPPTSVTQSKLMLRQLSIGDYSDPKTIVPHGKDVSIHFYIKSTGNHPWFFKALHIADTWAKDTNGDIIFMLDNNNHEEVDEEFSTRPWVKVKHVDGTDKQGGYKTARTIRYHGDTELAAKVEADAYKAQRLKTRAVFTEEEQMSNKADWICYLDDDMVTNVENLKMELLSKGLECSPDCIIGDKRKHGNYYTGGGWCMNQDFVQRTTALLRDKTDEELGWMSNDDNSFHKAVIINALGAETTDSEKIFSQLSWGKDEPKRLKYGMGKDEFAEKILPLLAIHPTVILNGVGQGEFVWDNLR
jgi:hypothetical protein